MDEDDLLDGLNELTATADMKQPKPANTQKPAPAQPQTIKANTVNAEPQKPKKAASKPVKSPDTETTPEPVTTQSSPESANFSLYFLGLGMLGLILFALGMGFGAMVSSGHFPAWDKGPGFLHALSAWVMAPAGILILPILAGAFFLAGIELRGEKKHAGIFFGLSGLLLVITIAALLLP